MKHLFALLLFVPGLAFATPKFGTLKDTMKELGARVKTISLQVDDSSLDTQSAALADDVAMLADDSKTFIPDLIAQAPAGDRAGMTVQYEKMLDETHQLAIELATALRSGNKVDAKDRLARLSQNKKDGHAEFK